MRRIAVLFPGQGSQSIGMLNSLLSRGVSVRKLVERADATLGYSLSGLIARGPLPQLTATEHAQPAIVLTSLCHWELYQQGGGRSEDEIVAVAGHSIGEYAAMAVAGMFSFEQIITLASLRGRLMAEHARRGPPGAMTVITHCPEQQMPIKRFLEEGMDKNAASIAAVNSPTQIVISGCLREIIRMESILSVSDRFRITSIARLPRVSCAFHSPLMRAASEAFYLAALPILQQAQPPRYPLINNVFADGRNFCSEPLGTVNASTSATPLSLLLREQIVRPVLWYESMKKIISSYHPNGLLPMGPGTILASLLRRDPQMASFLLDNECDQ